MPLDDKLAAELISQSLDRPLSGDEAEQLDTYLSHNPHGQQYARMLRLQQKIASDMMQAAEHGDHLATESLSAASRGRIEDMLATALNKDKVVVAAETSLAVTASPRQRDLAFASVLLESQRLSPEQLSSVSVSWANSKLSLSDYLVDRAVVTPDARDILETRALNALQNTAAGAKGETVFSTKQASRWSFHRSGVSAQLSQLLGMQQDEPEFLDVDCRFRLLRQIGEGGLGSVWLARDERLNRNVAVKRLHVNGDESPHAIARFRREAEITGHLEHLNIIPVYLAGTDRCSHKDLYVMRFVGKRTLTDAIHEYHDVSHGREKEGTQLHRLLGKFLRVCDAIAYAHSRGVIHRDLKPDNIALDGFGQVIVLDWGMAKVTDDGELGPQLALSETANDATPVHTMDGAVIGTPLYMSPEQAGGDIDSIDYRTDVYGLGGLLFAILTGRAPHENSATTKGGAIQITELINAIAEQDSPSPRQIDPEIPIDLVAICNKALSFSRAGRYESVTLLSDEINSWLSGSHQRQQKCDALRTQGRDLVGVLTNCFRDLANNARFMGTLPPIQQLVQAFESDNVEEFTVWRERLTTIFRGLLQTNPDLSGVTYQQVSGSEVRDLVRIERHSTDESRIRAVPQSRLTQTSATFAVEIQRQVPDEAVSAISTREVRNGRQAAYLETGIPIFDEQTEESFGNIIIEASLERLLADFLKTAPSIATEVIVCDGQQMVLAYWNHQPSKGEAVGSRVSDISPEWADQLSDVEIATIETEWTDESSGQFHIHRIRANTFDFGEAFVLVRL